MITPDYEDLINETARGIRRWVTYRKVMTLFRDMVRQYVREFRERSEAHRKWQAEYDEHVERIRRDPRLRDQNAGPPEPGWEWQEYPWFRRKADGTPYRDDTEGWTPPHLLEESRVHEPSHPLPFSDFPFERQLEAPLTMAAKFATLAALHDTKCVEFEKINPYPDDSREGGPYRALMAYAKTPSERGEEVLPEILREVEHELRGRKVFPWKVRLALWIQGILGPFMVRLGLGSGAEAEHRSHQASRVHGEVKVEPGGQRDVPADDEEQNQSAPGSTAGQKKQRQRSSSLEMRGKAAIVVEAIHNEAENDTGKTLFQIINPLGVQTPTFKNSPGFQDARLAWESLQESRRVRGQQRRDANEGQHLDRDEDEGQ